GTATDRTNRRRRSPLLPWTRDLDVPRARCRGMTAEVLEQQVDCPLVALVELVGRARARHTGEELEQALRAGRYFAFARPVTEFPLVCTASLRMHRGWDNYLAAVALAVDTGKAVEWAGRDRDRRLVEQVHAAAAGECGDGMHRQPEVVQIVECVA